MTIAELLALPAVNQAHFLMDNLIAHVTNGAFEGGDDAYRQLRVALRQDPALAPLIPESVRSSTNLQQFWSTLKQWPHYQERREYLWKEFAPLIAYLEAPQPSPLAEMVEFQLSKVSPDLVQSIWQKALQRVPQDPEGAITAARTLLETVCKHLLDDAGVTYPKHIELPKLWRMASEQINLTPDQHEEQIFKTILGGAQAAVGGLGELRNAALAVNLAGAMAAFLVATWLEQSEGSDPS